MEQTTFFAFPWDGDHRIRLTVSMTPTGPVITQACLPHLEDIPVGDTLYDWLADHGYEPAIFQLEETINPKMPPHIPDHNPEHFNRTGGVDSCEEYASFYRRECPCRETQGGE